MNPALSALAIATMLALSGCGGGGGGEDTPIATLPVSPATPTPSPSPTPTPTPAPTPSATIWRPAVTDSWQWQLHGTLDTRYAVTVYDVDLADTPRATIDTLHAQGRRVICYFSAGSAEDFWSDYGRFAAADMGNKLDGWAGERWLDIRSANVRAIMRDRLTLAASKTCDGVEPDNVDGYANKSGFALTAADQLDYNRFLAAEAHARALAVGLKNDLDQVTDLVDAFDYAVNEQCHEYRECDRLQPFTARRKPVFNAEYADAYVRNTGGARDQLCRTAQAEGFRTLVLPLELDDSFRFTCD